MNESPRIIDAKEQAKIIRRALKEVYPRTKFRVRLDRPAIRINWIDGPTEAQVNAVVQGFAGGGFDGMIDYQYSTVRRWKGEPVKFGADFIFTNRRYSRAFVDHFLPRACDKAGAYVDAVHVTGSDREGYAVRVDTPDISTAHWFGKTFEGYSLEVAQPSATMRHLGTYAYSPDHPAEAGR